MQNALSLAVTAQNPQYVQYTENDGLPSNRTIFSILQDKEGYIWVASIMGIARYDGKVFKHFPVDGSHEFVPVHMEEAADGRVWALSYKGELAYEQGGIFHLHSANESVSNLLKGGGIRDFFIDTENNVHFGTLHDGIWRLSPFGKLEKCLNLKDEKACIGVWFPDSGHPVVCGFNSKFKEQKLTAIKLFQENFTCFKTINLPVDIKSSDVHIQRTVISDSAVALGIQNYIFSVSKHEGLTDWCNVGDYVNSIAVDSRGTWFLGTRFNGLMEYPEGKLNGYTPIIYYQDNKVTAVVVDRYNAIWVAVNKAGLWQIPSSEMRLYTRSNSNLKSNDLKHIICQNGECYIVSGENELFHFENESFASVSTFEYMQTINSGVFDEFYFDSLSQRMYLAYHDRIGYLKEGLFTEILLDTLLPRNLSFRSFLSLDSCLWVFGHGGGVCLKSDEVVSITQPINARLVYSEVTPKGEILLGGPNGIFKLEKNEFVSLDTLHPVCGTRITEMCRQNERIWIATVNNGLGYLKDDQVVFPEKLQELNKIRKMVLDADTLWAMGTQHLHKIVAPSSGLLAVEKFRINFSAKRVLVDFTLDNNCFYLTTSEGLFTVEKQGLINARAEPVSKITGFQIHNRDTTLHNHYDLNYRQDMIRIVFNGIDYRSLRPHYIYRLVGMDETWQTTNQSSIQYTKLTPGDYIFEVFMVSSEGIKSKNASQISFSIHPPFWETWWFKLLAALVILVLVFAIVKTQIQRIRKKQETNRKLYDLESQALRAQMNPHFIFNVLAAIQRYVTEEDSDSSEIYLSKFAHLIRLILENSRKTFVPLEEELDMITYYIEMEKMRFEHSFDYCISVPENIAIDLIEIPPMLIQPYVENAIIHGIGSLSGKGLINLEFYLEGNLLHCKIDDNGIGFDPKKDQSEKANGHRSLGMLISAERLELLGTASNFTPTVKITYLDQQQKTGTSVHLEIPIKY